MKQESPATLRSDALLLVTAAIWGTAFVAQRAGMQHVGPFTFNAVRFALGALSLIPFYLLQRRAGSVANRHADSRKVINRSGTGYHSGGSETAGGLVTAGIIAGGILFLGSSFQQVGIVYTTAGNAGFITGLYVIIVPMLGLMFGQRPGTGVWIGALLAAGGLYFINGTPGIQLGKGDVLVLFCALFFAIHVLIIGRISPGLPALPLSIIQFLTCAGLSLAAAAGTERIQLTGLLAAAVPILYGGIGSVGIAYTLQVVAQKHAPPGHAAIILSLESPFALIGGWLLLGEAVPALKLVGCILMLGGMLSAQAQRYRLFNQRRQASGPSSGSHFAP